MTFVFRGLLVCILLITGQQVRAGKFSAQTLTQLKSLKENAEFQIKALETPESLLKETRKKLIQYWMNGVGPSQPIYVRSYLNRLNHFQYLINHLRSQNYDSLPNSCHRFLGSMQRVHSSLVTVAEKFFAANTGENFAAHLGIEILGNELMSLYRIQKLSRGLGNKEFLLECAPPQFSPSEWNQNFDNAFDSLNRALVHLGVRGTQNAFFLTGPLADLAEKQKIKFFGKSVVQQISWFIGPNLIVPSVRAGLSISSSSWVRVQYLREALIWAPFLPSLGSALQKVYFTVYPKDEGLDFVEASSVDQAIQKAHKVSDINFNDWAFNLLPLAMDREQSIFDELTEKIERIEESSEILFIKKKIKEIQNFANTNYGSFDQRVKVLKQHLKEINLELKRKNAFDVKKDTSGKQQ